MFFWPYLSSDTSSSINTNVTEPGIEKNITGNDGGSQLFTVELLTIKPDKEVDESGELNIDIDIEITNKVSEKVVIFSGFTDAPVVSNGAPDVSERTSEAPAPVVSDGATEGPVVSDGATEAPVVSDGATEAPVVSDGATEDTTLYASTEVIKLIN